MTSFLSPLNLKNARLTANTGTPPLSPRGPDPILSKNRVLLVMNMLPLKIEKAEDGWKVEHLNHLGSVNPTFRLLREKEGINFLWLGWIGFEVTAEEDRKSLTELLRTQYNAVPIFLPAKLATDYYFGFCKSILWPLLHYAQVRQWRDEHWDAYQSINQMYFEAVNVNLQETDCVWVLDYHLMLLPALLRRYELSNKIGFFLHSPFPTSEIFRTLPARAELLTGLHGADLIGFQTYNDVRHFLSSSSRVLGCDTSPLGVEAADGRFVNVGVFPVGIDPDRFQTYLSQSASKQKQEELRQKFGGKLLLVGRNRLDRINGVTKKFLAFEEFLQTYPQWKGKVCLVQVDEPPGNDEADTAEDIKKITREIHETFGRINGQLGAIDWMPIHYSSVPLSFEDAVALWSIADAAIVTPLRDGMNLLAYEFTLCQRDHFSPLILSEFTGAAQSLSGSRLVNPWNRKDFAKAINEVLTMNLTTRRQRHNYNYKYVITHSGFFWGKSFLQELLRMGPNEGTPLLNVPKLKGAFDCSPARVLLLDYDGTLTPIARYPSMARPSQSLLNILEELCKDPRNIVFLISGRDRNSLQGWVGHIKQLGLSCEHGLFMRIPGEEKWLDATVDLDVTWKEVVIPILDEFTDRTPGSFVEHKQMNVAWHFRNADHDYATEQAKDLILQLESLKLPIEVLKGKKTIEVRPRGINKGSVVKRITSLYPDAEFVLCIGDDKTDEDMFNAIDWMAHAYTVMVDNKPTAAKYYLEKQSDVLRVLGLLVNKRVDDSPRFQALLKEANGSNLSVASTSSS